MQNLLVLMGILHITVRVNNSYQLIVPVIMMEDRIVKQRLKYENDLSIDFLYINGFKYSFNYLNFKIQLIIWTIIWQHFYIKELFSEF